MAILWVIAALIATSIAQPKPPSPPVSSRLAATSTEVYYYYDDDETGGGFRDITAHRPNDPIALRRATARPPGFGPPRRTTVPTLPLSSLSPTQRTDFRSTPPVATPLSKPLKITTGRPPFPIPLPNLVDGVIWPPAEMRKLNRPIPLPINAPRQRPPPALTTFSSLIPAHATHIAPSDRNPLLPRTTSKETGRVFIPAMQQLKSTTRRPFPTLINALLPIRAVTMDSASTPSMLKRPATASPPSPGNSVTLSTTTPTSSTKKHVFTINLLQRKEATTTSIPLATLMVKNSSPRINDNEVRARKILPELEKNSATPVTAWPDSRQIQVYDRANFKVGRNFIKFDVGEYVRELIEKGSTATRSSTKPSPIVLRETPKTNSQIANPQTKSKMFEIPLASDNQRVIGDIESPETTTIASTTRLSTIAVTSTTLTSPSTATTTTTTIPSTTNPLSTTTTSSLISSLTTTLKPINATIPVLLENRRNLVPSYHQATFHVGRNFVRFEFPISMFRSRFPDWSKSSIAQSALAEKIKISSQQGSVAPNKDSDYDSID